MIAFRTSCVRPSLRLVRRAALVLSLAALLAVPVQASADSTFSITGRGWGHGIGMSQWGAKGLADNGYTYDRILKHYYRQTTLGSSSNIVVKVNLDSGRAARSAWQIKAGTSSSQLMFRDGPNSTPIAPLSGTRAYWVTVESGDVCVRTSSDGKPGSLIKRFNGAAEVYATKPTNGEPPLVTILSKSGPFDMTGVRWRSVIDFQPSGGSASTAINRIRMEDYLYGVVPRESPSSWPAEALKAQAVAARSYAYTSAAGGSVLACTVSSQVYNGHSRVVSSGIDMHEQTSTNKAISSTAGQVVKYGSTVVTTFFFSSSGGHTANIQDVWCSAAKPYYVGVPDPYENSPYTKSWGDPILMSGSTMATKIRARFPSIAPVGQTVIGVTPTRASSGHVTQVSLLWSNGVTTYLHGDSFRSALGLRSTVLYVSGDPVFATPTGATRYEQDEGRIEYSGAWRVDNDASLSGGSYTFSTEKGATAKLRFKGTAVYWVSRKKSSYGLADVYLDGVYQGKVSLYAPQIRYRQLVWSKTGLADGVHTLEIRVRQERDPRGTSYHVGVDAIDVAGTLLSPPSAIRFEQDRLGMTYSGTWLDHELADLSSGTYRYSKTAGSVMSATFNGTAVYWVTTTKNAYGIAEVFLDGVSQGKVDLYSASTDYQKVVWFKRGLAPGQHRLEIKCLGERNPNSLNVNVGIDAIDVVGSGIVLPSGVTRVEQADSRMVLDGSWLTDTDKSLSGGSYAYSTSAGATAKLRFKGTAVYWITRKKSAYGLADVYLDGVHQGRVSLYAPEIQYQQVAWSRTGLADAEHTLEIRVLHEKDPRGTSYHVGVDAIDVVGTALASPLPVRYEQTRPEMRYTGTWMNHSDANLSGGSYRYTKTAGSTMKVAFDGTAVYWVTTTKNAYGMAEVFLDGVSQGKVNLYSAATQYRKVVWSKTGLTPGRHQLEIRCLGQRDSRSLNVNVGVDALDIVGLGPVSSVD